MIRIGVFSRISQVPVSTLRYYDDVGLLKAAYCDSFTGYRYYQVQQLVILRRILALKDLGLSLEEIATLLKRGLPTPELRGMLRLKQAELQRQMREQQERLARLEDWLTQIEQEETMPAYEVTTKRVEALPVLSVRAVLPTYSAQGALWDELGEALGQNEGLCEGPGITVYHQDDPEIDAEVCMPLRKGVKDVHASGRVQVSELPAVETMATTLYHGPLNRIGDGYNALMGWIERQGYEICGPAREVYLQGPDQHNQADPKVVVELQAPVRKT